MPDTTTSLVDLSAAQATAVADRLEEVQKKVVAKFAVIAKRTDALNVFTAAHNAKIAGLEAAITAATTPEQIETALASKEYSFNERFYQFGG